MDLPEKRCAQVALLAHTFSQETHRMAELLRPLYYTGIRPNSFSIFASYLLGIR